MNQTGQNMFRKSPGHYQFGDSKAIPSGGSALLTLPEDGCKVYLRVRHAKHGNHVPACLAPSMGPLILRDDGENTLHRHQLSDEESVLSLHLPSITSGEVWVDRVVNKSGQELKGEYQIIKQQYIEDVKWFLEILQHQMAMAEEKGVVESSITASSKDRTGIETLYAASSPVSRTG